MNQLFRRGTSLFLSFLLILALVPSVVFAADGEDVLKELSHVDAAGWTEGSTANSFIIYVPSSYSKGELDFSNGVIKTEEAGYSEVILSFAGPVPIVDIDPANPKKTDPGKEISLTVTYKDSSDNPGTTVYKVAVLRNKPVDPQFSGTIAKSIRLPATTLGFTVKDFKDLYVENDAAEISSIYITGANEAGMQLKWGTGSPFGTKLALSSVPSNLTFTASNDIVFTGDTKTIYYNVQTYKESASGGAEVLTGSVTIAITVQKPSGIIELSGTTTVSNVPMGSVGSFKKENFTERLSLESDAMSHIKILTIPAAADGTLTYEGYAKAVTVGQIIPLSKISELKFIAAKNTGSAAFTFSGSLDGTAFDDLSTATISIPMVAASIPSVKNYEYSTKIRRGTEHSVSTSAFPSSATYIKIGTIPAAASGTLKLSRAVSADSSTGVVAIARDEALKSGAIIPASHFDELYLDTQAKATAADISFAYTATSGAFANKASWSSSVTYKVLFETSTGGTVAYSTGRNVAVKFNSSDFQDAFYSATGGTVDYIQFKLPATADGKLYYNYEDPQKFEKAVTAGDKYYRSSAPYISDVTFLPYTGYTGKVTIDFDVYSTHNNDKLTGRIEIDVDADATGGTVTFYTTQNSPVNFTTSAFTNAFNNATDRTLNYVRFSLPSSSYGTLYRNYSSSSGSGSSVNSSTSFYRNGSPLISTVTFVPYRTYTGTVTFNYTGYDSNGNSYKGKVRIVINKGSDGGDVTYYTDKNTSVKFTASDFGNAFSDASGYTLSYLTFNLPSSSHGTLYYDYSSSSSSNTSISSSTKYYRSGTPNLSNITFVPKNGYTGTVSIGFRGYTSSGSRYDGTVRIVVGTDTSSGAGTVSFDVKRNTPFTFTASAFANAFNSSTGNTLDYVRFTLPQASRGKLYFDYTSASNYAGAVSASTSYYRSGSPNLNYVTFVPATDYTGTFSMDYDAYDTSGYHYTGVITITVSGTAKTSSIYFDDVTGNYSWAAESVDRLYDLGVVTGTSTNIYSPGNNTRRADFMLMLVRGFDLKSSSSDSNFKDVPSSKYYYDAIAAAKALKVATGDGENFYPESNITRQDAMVLVVRVLEYKGNTLAAGRDSDMAGFYDKGSIDSYAYEAMAKLVRAGVIQGSDGLIRPKAQITRAELAVVLDKALNL